MSFTYFNAVANKGHTVQSAYPNSTNSTRLDVIQIMYKATVATVVV